MIALAGGEARPDAAGHSAAWEGWQAGLAAQRELEALPVYMAGRVPAGLATRRQLRADGLSAAGLKPAARLHYCAYHYLCPLYERSAARPVHPVQEVRPGPDGAVVRGPLVRLVLGERPAGPLGR